MIVPESHAPEFRRDPVTGRWVIVAPERSLPQGVAQEPRGFLCLRLLETSVSSLRELGLLNLKGKPLRVDRDTVLDKGATPRNALVPGYPNRVGTATRIGVHQNDFQNRRIVFGFVQVELKRSTFCKMASCP